MDVLELVRWGAAICVIAASLMVAWGEPARLVAVGFCVFTLSSALWIGAAAWEAKWALVAQNVVLLGVNVWGIYRWWGRAAREAGGEGAATA